MKGLSVLVTIALFVFADQLAVRLKKAGSAQEGPSAPAPVHMAQIHLSPGQWTPIL